MPALPLALSGISVHEASLAQGLLELVINAVREHNDAHPDRPIARIREIACEMGLIACVEAQTLAACFELFAEGTPAEGATLTLAVAPLASRCEDCGHVFELRSRHFICPKCGGGNIHFSGGHGLTLQSLRVDTEETHHD